MLIWGSSKAAVTFEPVLLFLIVRQMRYLSPGPVWRNSMARVAGYQPAAHEPTTIVDVPNADHMRKPRARKSKLCHDWSCLLRLQLLCRSYAMRLMRRDQSSLARVTEPEI